MAFVALLYASLVQASGAPVVEPGEYARVCGICHLETGEGVPGAFPPLDARLGDWARTEQGRRYLVNVVVNGLHGQIEVDGVRYFGAMPGMAHQLSHHEIAGLLNYVVGEFGGGSAALTEKMVDEIRAVNGAVQSLGLRPE